MKKYFDSQPKWRQAQKEEDCKAYFRWDKNGIITDLELHAGVCMGVSAEDIKTIIDLIKKDNAQFNIDFEQALNIAVHFDFNITEFLK